MSTNEEAAAGEPPQANEERVGYRSPPLATRFRSGQTGNPRGRPKLPRSLSALVAAALRERINVTDENGRVRRMSKLAATVRQIVDGAVEGEPRSTKMLVALIKADDRLATGGPPARVTNEADAIVIAELRRRLQSGPKAPEAGRSDPDKSDEPARPVGPA